MCVCVYVCMCVSVYVCMCACVWVYFVSDFPHTRVLSSQAYGTRSRRAPRSRKLRLQRLPMHCISTPLPAPTAAPEAATRWSCTHAVRRPTTQGYLRPPAESVSCSDGNGLPVIGCRPSVIFCTRERRSRSARSGSSARPGQHCWSFTCLRLP